MGRVRRPFFVLLFVASASAMCAGRASAAVQPLMSAPGLSGPRTSPFVFTLGYELTVGAQPLRVTALGLWDINGDGLTAAHDVAIWNATGTTLLGQVTVPAGAGGQLVGSYRYADLASTIDLAAGATYVIGAAYNSDDTYRWFGGFGDFADNKVTGGVADIGFGRFTDGASLTFPTGTTSAIYSGPNLLFTAVPEPATLLLLPAAALAALLRRPRRA